MGYVFLKEDEFLAASDEIRRNRHGYRIQYGSQTYYVWASTSVHAMGLVAKHTQAMTSEVYTQREIKHNVLTRSTIDANMVAYVFAMTAYQHQKLREILRVSRV